MKNNSHQIEWQENCSVGDDQIDIQHKRILNYINLLSTPPYNSVNNDAFDELFNEVTEYAKFHLQYEEDLLKKLNYPDYESHKKEHEQLFEGTNIDTPEKLRLFLVGWWKEHILVQDMKFKPFLLSKKTGK